MDATSSTTAADSTATRQFRRELRRWRTRSGLTQRALADRIRFSRETVAAVESGRRYGSHELAVRCDEVLCTGGRLTALWPHVAAEQMAADGRRGPRMSDAARRGSAVDTLSLLVGPDGNEGEPAAVTIDELRELIDMVLSDRLPAPQSRRPGRVGMLGRRP